MIGYQFVYLLPLDSLNFGMDGWGGGCSMREAQKGWGESQSRGKVNQFSSSDLCKLHLENFITSFFRVTDLSLPLFFFLGYFRSHSAKLTPDSLLNEIWLFKFKKN